MFPFPRKPPKTPYVELKGNIRVYRGQVGHKVKMCRIRVLYRLILVLINNSPAV